MRPLNPERVVAEKLGSRIREARHLKRLSQQQLSEMAKLGLYRQLINKIEKGKHLPNLLQIYAIAIALDCDWLEWLNEIIQDFEQNSTAKKPRRDR